MKKVLLLLLAGSALYLGYRVVDSVKNQPATGVVEMEEVMTEEVTVMIEEETMESMEPVVMEEEVMEMEEVVEEFMPLAFDGKLKKFAEANGGEVIDASRLTSIAGEKIKKGVKIGKDIYFKTKTGLYVFHNGTIIKL